MLIPPLFTAPAGLEIGQHLTSTTVRCLHQPDPPFSSVTHVMCFGFRAPVYGRQLIWTAVVLGETQIAAVLSVLVSAQMPMHPNECTELLLALSENPAFCFPEVAETAVAGLDTIGTHDSNSENFDFEREEQQRPLGPQFL